MKTYKQLKPSTVISAENAQKLVNANALGPFAEKIKITKELIQIEYPAFDRKYEAIFVVAMVYAGNAISKASYVDLLKNIRDDKFLRRVNTYKSPVDNSWYNDEPILSIWKNHALTYGKELSFSEIIAALKLADFTKDVKVSKNNNYHVGRLFEDVLRPLYLNFVNNPSEYTLEPLKLIGVPVGEFKYNDVDTFGYCCEDCDGPIENFGQYSRNGKNKQMAEEAMNQVASWFNAVRFINRGCYDGPDVTYLKA